ncbi:site-specific integrase [Leuconostoc mesenteroides]|uniref:site-specific integrase n=1 Tax=Leuconostoc mesenteroides TaxID=1245 RepID=UPI000FFE1576|nr:site-specific integrase [Leuconostoc mesenteroides]QAT27253.1 site-specific integrase [Leuconostoc mesenteroides]
MSEALVEQPNFSADTIKNARKSVSSMKFCNYIKWFADNYKAGHIRPVTFQKWGILSDNIRKIAPDLRLKDLENNRLALQWLIDQFGKTHRLETVRNFKTMIIHALRYAVDDEYIKGIKTTNLTVNSVEKTWEHDKVNKVVNQKKFLEMGEFNKLKSFVDFKLEEMLDQGPVISAGNYTHKKQITEQTYYMIMSVGIHTGMRYAEVIGLTRDDIAPNQIDVNKTWDYKYSTGFALTKNDSSIRKVDIDSTLYNLLIKYSKFCDENDLSRDGLPLMIDPDTRMYNATVNEKLYKILDKLNIPRVSYHKLRHTYVSVMLSNGIQMNYIAKQVGHNNTNMINKVYGHLQKEIEEREASRTNAIFG